MSTAQVFETVTFYSLFFTQPVGRNVFGVCTNVSCMLRGGEELLRLLRKKLDIEVGQTTADGRFTLLEVECLASCDTAPVIQLTQDRQSALDRTLTGLLLEGYV